MNPQIEVVKGNDLSDVELSQMEDSTKREFKVDFDRNDLDKKFFFLLKTGSKIIAMGGLFYIEPVVFGDNKFSMYGCIEVISNVKGSGYGKIVMTSIRDYIQKKDVIMLGYCMPYNAGFYEKCGFTISKKSGQRFVYYKDGKAIRNQDGQVNFYLDSRNGFMTRIMEKSDGDIQIPTEKLW